MQTTSTIQKSIRRQYRKYLRFIKHKGQLRKALLAMEFERAARTRKGLLPEERSEHILQLLHARIEAAYALPMQAPVKRLWPASRVAAAAIIIILATAAVTYVCRHRSPQLAARQVAPLQDQVVAYVNEKNQPQSLTLPDGSHLKVWPGSSLSYYKQFTTTSRTISLKGKAIFEVAKDKARPFTVFAGDISTTALGTVFMVNTQEPRKVQVQLFEGKVMIRSASEKIAMHDVYLKAGEQFEINKMLGAVCVSPLVDSNNIAAGKKEKPLKNINNSVLEFNQTPLANVLASVGERYHVRFKFRNGDFNRMYVTGKFLPADSLPVVLNMLGTIYRLNFIQQNNTIEVTGR
jgi:ferric-dicitrate binding protein FerR (iron transport regulator)